ncbi:MAG: PEPxxWA-CTERM sorting domain-containing protein [Sphingobium sp.]|nr:PEPxxWA-CTERM sorting domain-containing protein [Sphingobium sp.]
MTLAAPAGAAVVFSSDFETPAYAGAGYHLVNSVQGWGLSAGPSIEVQHNNVAGLSHSGVQHVELDSTGNSAMSRVIGAGDYTLSFWYSPRPGVPLLSNLIEVLLDGTLIGSAAAAGQGQTVWTQQVLNFSLAGPAVLEFRAGGTQDSLGGYLDDIELSTAAVPEPASWALLLAGFALMGNAMRRRRVAIAFA